MTETNDLLRELISETKLVREELFRIQGVAGFSLEDVNFRLIELTDSLQGPDKFNLGDINDRILELKDEGLTALAREIDTDAQLRMSTPTRDLDDIYNKLSAIEDAILRQQLGR